MDARYDVAASTAAGALDFIVVNDTPTAQRCVELLRKRGLGVATFLLLDKQAHLAKRAAEKARPPEGTPWNTNDQRMSISRHTWPSAPLRRPARQKAPP